MKPTDLEKSGFNFKNQGSGRGLSPTLDRFGSDKKIKIYSAT